MMKHSKSFRIVPLLIAAALLTSCSIFGSMAQHDAAEHTLLNAYAGRPVSQIVYLAVSPGARTVSDDQILTWTDFTQAHAYLITVGRGCPNLYLAGGVHMTSTGNVVRANSDHVVAEGFVCPIKTIQPVDFLRVQRELAREELAGQDGSPQGVIGRG
jgi:Family of unknown function (DUF6491)